MAEIKNYTLNFSFGTASALGLSLNFAAAKLACTGSSAQMKNACGVGV
jgi:hypothetical protein